MDGYAGGWQEIFSDGGDPCTYKGTPLGFHARRPYREVLRSRTFFRVGGGAPLGETRPQPLSPAASCRSRNDSPRIRVKEHLINEGGETLPFMWGQHPAYGAPFLSGEAELTIPAAIYQRDGPAALNPPAGLARQDVHSL